MGASRVNRGRTGHGAGRVSNQPTMHLAASKPKKVSETGTRNGSSVTYKYLVGVLVSIVLLFGAGMVGYVFAGLQRHTELDGHPAIVERVDKVDKGVAELKNNITGRLSTIDGKVDKNQSAIQSVQIEQAKIGTNVEAIRKTVDKLDNGR